MLTTAEEGEGDAACLAGRDDAPPVELLPAMKPVQVSECRDRWYTAFGFTGLIRQFKNKIALGMTSWY